MNIQLKHLDWDIEESKFRAQATGYVVDSDENPEMDCAVVFCNQILSGLKTKIDRPIITRMEWQQGSDGQLKDGVSCLDTPELTTYIRGEVHG